VHSVALGRIAMPLILAPHSSTTSRSYARKVMHYSFLFTVSPPRIHGMTDAIDVF
jgi:hypothetical protein